MQTKGKHEFVHPSRLFGCFGDGGSVGVKAWWKRGDRVRHKATGVLGTAGNYSAITGHSDGRATVSGIIKVEWDEPVGAFDRGYYAQDLLESA